jgi:5-methylcytosine-specific restriction endonuclease McrA
VNQKYYRKNRILTEEEKRNLKIDLKKVGGWLREKEAIYVHFQKYSIDDLKTGAKVLAELREILRMVKWYDGTRELEQVNSFTSNLDTETLIFFKYLAPSFFFDERNLNITELVSIEVKNRTQFLREIEIKGIADSWFISLVSNKVERNIYENAKKDLEFYKSLIRKTWQVRAFLTIVDKIKQDSEQYNDYYSNLEKKLSLANQKKEAIEKFEKIYGNALAKAARSDQGSRERTNTVRALVRKTEKCPYCNNILGNNPHLDHIYPIAKGGLSIVENLVWCCSACNLSKSDKGLIQFLTKSNYPIQDVLTRLELMGKHI